VKKIKATAFREERTLWEKTFQFPDDVSDDEIDEVISEDACNTDHDPAWEEMDGNTNNLEVGWTEEAESDAE